MSSSHGFIAPTSSARLNLLADLVWLVIAAFFASSVPLSEPIPPSLFAFMTGSILVWVITAVALRHYDPAADRDTMDEFSLVSVQSAAVTTVLVVATLIPNVDWELPRVAQYMVTLWPGALFFRLAIFRVIAKREGPYDDVLLVGVGPMGRATAEDIVKGGKRRIAGFLKFNDEAQPESLPAAYLGTFEDLAQVLRTTAVDEVYLAGNALRHAESMQAAIKACEKFGIPFALPAYSFRLDRARPADSKALADGYVHYVSVDVKPSQLALKRLFDIVSSAVALWFLLIPFAFVALAIKLSSRGPVLFRQPRVGLRGKMFNMLKFRSMVVNAEELKAKLEKLNEQTGPVFKMTNDPRITGIGRFIRKYSIDELPQLINVLRGDMSVVGPRPPVPQEVAKYEAWQRRRLSVRPGLTCIWQVSGRNQITFEQWMYLDMQYIDHWSLKNDINLILKTVPVVITGKGAS